ncbi:hypothetical protein A4A49_02034 [Nicotiana attenuata]|uniref:Uncharacterized protein n=1 Tax=Nicotiana attenuata TaxID=49451 RepID=A0A1J6I6W1_NICAT|nr:hypothetical protein A4A49_02034 [Nicotiana attenuata]
MHIIEDPNNKNDDKGKGKAKEEAVTTKNSFDVLEERVNVKSSGNPNPIPNGNGSMATGKEGIPNLKGEGTNHLQDLIRVKKKAVEKVLEKEKKGNHSPTPTGKGTKAAIKEAGDGIANFLDVSTPIRTGNGGNKEIQKERTVDWVTRRFNAACEDIHVTTNYSCQHIPTQTFDNSSQGLETSKTLTDARKAWSDELDEVENTNAGDSSSKMKKADKSIGGDRGSSKEAGKQGESFQLSLSKKTGNGTVNPSKTGEILAFVDGVPVYALEKGLDENVNMKVRDDTVGSDQQIGYGNEGDLNGTAVVSSMEQNKGNEHAKEQLEQAIVPRSTGKVEAVPMACESGIDQIMRLQLNVP